MDRWPTSKDKKDGRYKVTSLSLFTGKNLQVTSRSTYSILEWLGDVGGLFDMLKLIGAIIVGPIAVFTRKQTLLTEVFRYVTSLAYSG